MRQNAEAGGNNSKVSVMVSVWLEMLYREPVLPFPILEMLCKLPLKINVPMSLEFATQQCYSLQKILRYDLEMLCKRANVVCLEVLGEAWFYFITK